MNFYRTYYKRNPHNNKSKMLRKIANQFAIQCRQNRLRGSVFQRQFPSL
jgi:hypothetical protein